MESESIKFETVFDAIQHYQREKTCLEETLCELSVKESQFKEDAQIATRNRVAAADRLLRATERFKLVQHKVEELQIHLSGLRETSERGTTNVEHINREVSVSTLRHHTCRSQPPYKSILGSKAYVTLRLAAIGSVDPSIPSPLVLFFLRLKGLTPKTLKDSTVIFFHR